MQFRLSQCSYTKYTRAPSTRCQSRLTFHNHFDTVNEHGIYLICLKILIIKLCCPSPEASVCSCRGVHVAAELLLFYSYHNHLNHAYTYIRCVAHISGRYTYIYVWFWRTVYLEISSCCSTAADDDDDSVNDSEDECAEHGGASER